MGQGPLQENRETSGLHQSKFHFDVKTKILKAFLNGIDSLIFNTESVSLLQKQSNIMSTTEGRKVLRLYNQILKEFVTYEYIWHRAWVHGICKVHHGKFSALQTVVLISST